MIWTIFYLPSFMIINSILVGWQATSAVPLEPIHLVKRGGGWFGGSKKARLTRVTTHNQKLQEAGWAFGTPDGKAPRTPVPRVRDHVNGFIKDVVKAVKYKVESTIHPDRPTPKTSVDLHKGPQHSSPSERKRLEEAGWAIIDKSSKSG